MAEMTEEEKRKKKEDEERAKLLGSGKARSAADALRERKEGQDKRLKDILGGKG